MKWSLKKYQFYKRLFDTIFALVGLIVFALPILLLGTIIKITSRGPIIYWSKRVGINNSCFRMAKLRTMKNCTPVLASNHFNKPEEYFILFGKFFREFGFDELPQLYNILKGEMSFVGPRPVVLDDYEIITLRKKKNVNSIKPGLTGLAQINGRNGMTIQTKVKYDEIYMQSMSILLDLKIIFLTNYYMMSENIFHKTVSNIEFIKLPEFRTSK